MPDGACEHVATTPDRKRSLGASDSGVDQLTREYRRGLRRQDPHHRGVFETAMFQITSDDPHRIVTDAGLCSALLGLDFYGHVRPGNRHISAQYRVERLAGGNSVLALAIGAEGHGVRAVGVLF